MKIENIIKNYAKYITANIKANELMNKGIKKELIKRVQNVVDLQSSGMLSVRESMNYLSSDCMSDGEDMSEYAYTE